MYLLYLMFAEDFFLKLFCWTLRTTGMLYINDSNTESYYTDKRQIPPHDIFAYCYDQVTRLIGKICAMLLLFKKMS